MASDATAIAKRAAQLLGISSSTVVDIVANPSSYEEKELAAAYPAVRDAELRKHRWNFAKKQTVILKETIADITAITAANPPVVTSASHGYSDGAQIYIDSVIGMDDVNDRTYTVANKTTNTFELSGIDGSGWDAYTSGGKLYGYVPWPYSYAYALPADYLQMVHVENVTDYDMDGSYFYCNSDTELAISYIRRITDPTKFEATFEEALSSRLAYELAELFTQSNTKKAEALQNYNDQIRWARRVNAIERGPMKRYVKADWVQVRR